MESKSSCKVCVTGGSGFIGSALVHSLLQNGYTVHATLRNLGYLGRTSLFDSNESTYLNRLYKAFGDESKVGCLMSIPCAEERLHLFEADIYKPEMFEEAIQGCVFVFHVATPLFHTTGYQYNGTVEASVDAAKKIADACIRSGTVKRLIYTASIVAASPLKDDGSGYKDTMDESCWTPLHLNVPYTNDFLKDYTHAKTISEQELIKIGEDKENELEVVTLCCAMVGGKVASTSPLVLISQITGNAMDYQALRYIEELTGEVPIVHIEDVCRAHIFCADTPSVNGRFLCASSFISSAKMAKYYRKTCPELNQEYFEELGREIEWGSRKLEDKGFTYKYDAKMILDDCLKLAKGRVEGYKSILNVEGA